MIVEKSIDSHGEKCALIHYLCVKCEYEGLNYAKKLLNVAMRDKDFKDKNVYVVSKLPRPYRVKYVQSFHLNDEDYKKNALYIVKVTIS